MAPGSGAMTVVVVSNSGGGRGGEDERDDEDDTVVAKATEGALAAMTTKMAIETTKATAAVAESKRQCQRWHAG